MVNPMPQLKEQPTQGRLARPELLIEAVIAVRFEMCDQLFKMDYHLAIASDAGAPRTDWTYRESSIQRPQPAVDLEL